MGTDIYLSWEEITPDEKGGQFTGFSINAGDKGYLRESIGSPHAYSFLVPEAFATPPQDRKDGEGPYDSILSWYGPRSFPTDGEVVGFDISTEPEFVTLTESWQIGEETHTENNHNYVVVPVEHMRARLPLVMERIEDRYEGDPEAVRMASSSAEGFVALAERKVAEGKRPVVYVSY